MLLNIIVSSIMVVCVVVIANQIFEEQQSNRLIKNIITGIITFVIIFSLIYFADKRHENYAEKESRHRYEMAIPNLGTCIGKYFQPTHKGNPVGIITVNCDDGREFKTYAIEIKRDFYLDK